MEERFIRTQSLIGSEGLTRLNNANVVLFGVGGVGSYAAEALIRSGVGSLTLIDGDIVAKSNINRQLIALDSTVGLPKAQVMAARAKDINPSCRITALNCFYDESNKDIIDFAKFDYVIDAIDTISSKLLIIELASRAGTRIISCMGAGNKLNAVGFEVADIYKTSVCPLARVMRRELKKRGIAKLKVVYSKEEPIKVNKEDLEIMIKEEGSKKRSIPASISFVPSVAGLIIAGEIIKDIIGRN